MTATVMLILTAGIIVWDVWLWRSPKHPTISQVMASLPKRKPYLFAVVFGAWCALAAHWWWPTCV